MLAATGMAWGGMFPVMKPLLAEIDPITLTLVRFGFSVPILIALLVSLEGYKALRMKGRLLRLWWLGTLGFTGFGVLLVFGLKATRPEHGAVVPALMPLITVAVVAIRTRIWPAAQALAAVAMAIAGVVLIVTHGDPSALLNSDAGRGEALILLGATCWVFYTLGAAEFRAWSALRYTTLTCALGVSSLAVLECIAVKAGVVALPTPTKLIGAAPDLAYLVLVASVMGLLFWNAGMQAVGPARGVLFINLVPVTAFAIAVLGGRVPGGAEIAGVALVISGLVLNSFQPTARAVRDDRSGI